MRRRALLRRAGVVAAAAATSLGVARAQPRPALRFLWWGGSDRHRRTLDAIAAFEAAHPGTRVKAEYMGFNGYLEKLTTQMVGGTEADVLQINWAWLGMFSRQGTGFLDLNAHRESLALAEYPAEDLSMCSVAGRLNGLPVSFSARIFLWNAAALARAGLAMPSMWNDLFSVAKAFRASQGERAYLLDGDGYDMLLLAQTYAQQLHGAAYVHPSEPRVGMSESAVRDWVDTYLRLYASGAATPVPYRISLGDKPTEQQPDWVVGRWAGNYTWDSAIRLRQSTLDKNQRLGLGPWLSLPGAKDSGMFGRPALLYTVSKHCKEPALAAEFLRFITTDPAAVRKLGSTRGIPSPRGARALLEAAGELPALELEAARQIDEQRRAGRLSPPSKRFEDARFRRFLHEVFDLLAYGRIGAAEGTRRLVDDGNALLRRIH